VTLAVVFFFSMRSNRKAKKGLIRKWERSWLLQRPS
jgi:hypothetical protein